MTKITHLNGASLTPPLVKVNGIIWCMLIEHSDGCVLVDTGFGTRDFITPTPLVRIFKVLLGVTSNPQQAIVNQIAHLGFIPSDIKHIILTHAHFDHTGGLPDFPDAQVHIHASEYASIQHPRRLLDYGHVKAHWAHNPQWVIHSEPAPPWFGFEAVSVLPGILFIPLPGHTSGHCGVAVQTGGGWILQAGDAISPYHPSSDADGRGLRLGYPMGWIPAGVSNYLLGDHTARIADLIRTHGDEVTVVSAHDGIAFESLGSPLPEAA